MYDEIIKRLRETSMDFGQLDSVSVMLLEAAEAIEEMNRRIGRAIELYNRNVEKSAMYEALAGISPEPTKEE